jgi:DNA-binding response OmpR family regulator
MSGRRILVVDDNEEILGLTATVLGGAGFTVVTVPTGKEALEQLAAAAFDLVLLDINMPGLDGWEVLRLIRSDVELDPALPVVMFSIKGEVRDKVQGLQEGATDYITKPFVVDKLVDRVRRVLESTAGKTRPGAAP